MRLPPIQLQRLYASDGSGQFTIQAKHLPAHIWDRLTDEQKMARRDQEKAAEQAEWERIKRNLS